YGGCFGPDDQRWRQRHRGQVGGRAQGRRRLQDSARGQFRGAHRLRRPSEVMKGEVRQAAALVVMLLLAACGGSPAKEEPGPQKGVFAVARLQPKNGSNGRGFISFGQTGDKV